MQQMAFMLVAVVVFFALVGLFYFNIISRNLRGEANRLQEEQAIQLAKFVSMAGEFSCGSYCVDFDRLMAVKNMSVYKNYWPVAYIKFKKITETNKECNFGNYPACDYIELFRNTKINNTSSASDYVALCRYEKVNGYVERVCELGKIIIGYEVK